VVAEGVVDLLEAVEVEQQQGQRRGGDRDAGAPRVCGRQRPFQAPQQQGAVGQVGQRIVQGLMFQRLLRPLARGDVAHDTAVEGPLGRGPGGQRELERKLHAVAAQPMQLDRLADDPRLARRAVALQPPRVRLPVALRHQDGQRPPHHLAFAIAEDRRGARVPGDDQAPAVGRDDGVARRLGHGAEAQFARPQRLLGPAALGDVPERHHRADQDALLVQRRADVLDRNGRAVLAPEDLVVRAMDGPVREGRVDRTLAGWIGGAVGPRVVGRGVHGPADQLVGRVAEQAGRRGVDESGHAAPVHAEDALARGVQDGCGVALRAPVPARPASAP